MINACYLHALTGEDYRTTATVPEDDVSLAGVLQDAVGRAVCCVFAVFGG